MGSPAKKTMLFVLLDESGSMGGMESDVINGINTLIKDQLAVPEPAVMAIAVFGSHIPEKVKIIRPMIALSEIQLLTPSDYRPMGGTPLLDATGKCIQSLDEDWKREKPDRCIFASFTDGLENDSHEFTKTKIKQLITAREKSGLWNFMFLGANIDAFEAGASMGYTTNKMSNYTGTGKGFRSASKTLGESFTTLRNADDKMFAASASGVVDVGLGGSIDEDGNKTQAKDWVSAMNDLQKQVNQQKQPPAAAMTQESWTPPTSSALFDPKVDAWKPPV